MQRPAHDWAGNLVAFAFVIVMNTLSNALPINGQSMPEISAKYPSLFTPAGFTFSIWGVIYIALLAFVAWQAMPAQRSNQRVVSISRYFQANCLLNGLWLVVWHYDLVALSLVVMLGILATLILTYRELRSSIDTASFATRVVLYAPFSLYTGWITVATIANASVLQTANGWDNIGLTAVQWTLVKLAVAGAIGAAAVFRLRDIVFGAAVVWAAYGISVMQSAYLPVAGAAATLSLLLALSIATEVVSRLRSR